MPRIHHAERALALSKYSPRPQYVCRACRAHVVRQMHTTRRFNAELGFFQRMRETIFGSKESRESQKKREEKTEELAKQDAARSEVKTKRDSKGKVYQVAAVVDSSTHPEYVEATNWDGLRRIGGEQWMKEQLDGGEQYVGFMPEKRAKLDKVHWQKVLHHVAVEVLALQKAGRGLNEVCHSRKKDNQNWQHTNTAKITRDDATGNATVTFETKTAEETVLSAIKSTEKDGIVRTSTAKALPRTLGGIDGATDTSWMTLPIKDALIKLAACHRRNFSHLQLADLNQIAKRMTQLTGHRISDPTLSNANTLQDLYSAVITREPPKKLAQTRELHDLRNGAPNVRVHMRRQTPIHKEKAIGRWKIIEEELVARDLPVTGARRHPRPVIAPLG